MYEIISKTKFKQISIQGKRIINNTLIISILYFFIRKLSLFLNTLNIFSKKKNNINSIKLAISNNILVRTGVSL